MTHRPAARRVVADQPGDQCPLRRPLGGGARSRGSSTTAALPEGSGSPPRVLDVGLWGGRCRLRLRRGPRDRAWWRASIGIARLLAIARRRAADARLAGRRPWLAAAVDALPVQAGIGGPGLGVGRRPPPGRPAGSNRHAGGAAASRRAPGAGRGRPAAALPALRHRAGAGRPRGPAGRGPEPLVRRHARRAARPAAAVRLAGGAEAGGTGRCPHPLVPRGGAATARRLRPPGGRAPPELGAERARRPPGPRRPGDDLSLARPGRPRIHRPA